MTNAAELSFLDWHADWLPAYAQDRAAAAYLEMHDLPDHDARDERGLLFWERIGLALAGAVLFGMDGIEEPAFIERAQLTAIEIYLRRLHHLLRMSPIGGSA